MINISFLSWLPALAVAVLAACGSDSAVSNTVAPSPVMTATPSAMQPDSVAPSAPEKGLTVDELMGKFNPEEHPDFVKVGKPYTDKAGMMLRKETMEAFMEMHKAAAKDGIRLNIISSTRNFGRQKEIWEAKWAKYAKDYPEASARALKILEYSSMPGTSRHHWGTDIDLNDLNNPTFEKGGTEEKTYLWLEKNAHTFGFCQPYTPKGAARPNGYNEEKWHWSYLPLSQKYLAQYLKAVQNDMIAGFKGAETAVKINAVGNFAGGINKACTGQ